MIEKEMIIKGKNPIYGTMTMPAENGKYPAILILAGSGPLDRNGNDKKGKFQTNLYRNIADFFSNLGYVTFRYDKIGTGKRTGDLLMAGLTDLVADAKQAFSFLQSQPFVDREKVIICGHSEGTILATAVAEIMNPGGVMLLSGGVDNLIEALQKQRQLAYKELLAQSGFQGWLNRKLKVDVKGEKQTQSLMDKMIQSDKDVIRYQLFFKQPAKYFREHNAFNTRAALKNVTCPVFAIQGDKDPLVDNEVLKELPLLVQGSCECHIIPDMDHALKNQHDPKNILNYKKHFIKTIDKPFEEEALKRMSTWLSSLFEGNKASWKQDEIMI